MNDDERDDLLVRIDERVKQTHEILAPLPGRVQENTADIRWIKWLGTSAFAIMMGVVAVIEWFKK